MSTKVLSCKVETFVEMGVVIAVQSLSRAQRFVTPRAAALQAS